MLNTNVDLHPIENGMEERIHKELRRIEQEYDVTVLYACESGSRGWGFASTDSDYDVRFIYVEKPDYFLSLKPKRDIIESPVDSLLDISGWSLSKTLGLLNKSNPAVFEWLDSPIVYTSKVWFMKQLRELAPMYFNPKAAWWHYRSLAHNTYNRFLTEDKVRLKKYFYSLRPIMAANWVETKDTIPPMVFEELISTITDPELLEAIEDLVRRKSGSTEAKEIDSIPILKEFIYNFLSKATPEFTTVSNTMDNLDSLMIGAVKYYA